MKEGEAALSPSLHFHIQLDDSKKIFTGRSVLNFTGAQQQTLLAHQHLHLPFLGGSSLVVIRRRFLLVPV